MSNLVVGIISIIDILVLLFIAIFIIKKRVIKIERTLLWFFIPVYIVNWSLYFCAVFDFKSDTSIYLQIVEISIDALKCFILDFNIDAVSYLVKTNALYAVALFSTWLLSSFNTIYILVLSMFFTFWDQARAKFINKKPHYIVIIDDFSSLDYVFELDLESIIILDDNINLKKEAREFSSKRFCFIYNDDKEKALYIAGIKTKGTIVISLSKNENKNLEYLKVLNKIAPSYVKSFINYSSFDAKSFVDNKNVFIYNIEDLVARDFISKYPLYKEINSNMIDESKAILKDTNIKHFFMGFNKFSKALLINLVMNYQMINDRIKLYICDLNATNILNSFNGSYYVNKYIQDINNNDLKKNEYFDLEDSRFDISPISYEKDSYELKMELIRMAGSFNLYYIDYDNDLVNFEAAMELESLLKSYQITNYKIYVRLYDKAKFDFEGLNKRNIYIYGDNKSILSKRIIIEEKMDDFAKIINAYYSSIYNNDNKSVDEQWDSLSLIDKCSNRSAAMNIIAKLNLIGLGLAKDKNTKGISNEEYYQIYANGDLSRNIDMKNYNFDNKRINLGILEHYRWNSFQILNNIMPMKKENIFKNNKYNRKNKEERAHSNILSLKGLLDLEEYLAKLEALGEEERKTASQIFIKDFDLMDNLPLIIKDSEYKIVSLK